jgi:DNA invertase Pin-like site-specific DNA recombinase
MKVIGYVRVSSDKQDAQKQEHLLLKYAQQQHLQIDEFINLEISARQNTQVRRIDELLKRLDANDVLLVVELSRLGRNMFEVLNIINQLSENGVRLVFVRQPELSTTGPHGKLLLAIYSYFAEADGISSQCVLNKGSLPHGLVANNWGDRRGVETRRAS